MVNEPSQSFYEYHLKYWGGVDNEKWIERDLGINQHDFWFKSAAERDIFREKLQAVADRRRECIVFFQSEGVDVRKRTIANMNLRLPDGRVFKHRYDFGFGYDPGAAEFMYFDGNYACDCNKSIFLSCEYPEISEFKCGSSIKIEDFNVTLELQQ